MVALSLRGELSPVSMHLALIDWVIVAAMLLIGFNPALFFGKRAGKNRLWARNDAIEKRA